MAEKKIISLRKKRNMLTAKKIFKTMRIPVVVLAVAAALFLSARLMGNVAVSNITDGIRQVKTVFTKSGGFPYSLDTFNFKKADSIGSGVITVNNDSTVVLNSSADELFNMQIKPGSRVITQNGRALIYGTASNEVVLQSKTEELGSITEDSAVVAAAIAENGSFATSHASEKHQSILRVYNSRFKNVFQWNCSQERIADIALSQNGRNVAVAAVGAENAEIYTRIIVFNIGDTEPKADVKFSGTMFFDVVYTASGKIIAAGDNKTVVLNKKGETVDETVYAEDSILAVCSDDSGNTVVCYEEFGGAKTGIARYSRSGKKTCSIVVDGIPDCIAADGGRIAVASGNETVVYSQSGKEVKRIESENAVESVFIASGTVYAVDGSAIYKY